MTGSLRNVRIQLDVAASPQHLRLCANSVEQQARMLGMESAAPVSAEPESGWSYAMILPDGSPVANRIQSWPESDKPAAGEFDVQARSGILSVHSRAAGKARPLGLPYVSTLTASLSLQAALAGCVAQQRGARVEQTNSSLGGAALVAMMQYLSEGDTDLSGSGVSDNPTVQPPFVTADGVCFEMETLSPDIWQAFWLQMGFSGPAVARGWAGFMQRYARACAAVPCELVLALSDKTWDRLSTIARHTGMALCPIRSLDERNRDADTVALSARGPWSFAASAAPQRVERERGVGHLPLSGIRVVESCRRIQGPLAGRLLQWLGAEVIRLEPPGGDPLRAMQPTVNDCSIRFQALNGDKTIREVDIKSATGREQVRELVRDSDVFLHNWAPGKAEQLGLDASDLHRINPRLVYFYAGGWEEGGEPPLPGTDFMVQAYSGVAAEVARQGGGRGGSLFTLLDVLGGALASQGVCAGLLQSRLAPAAVRGYSSLLGAAHLLTREPPKGSEQATLPPSATQLSEVPDDPLLSIGLHHGAFCQVMSPWRFV